MGSARYWRNKESHRRQASEASEGVVVSLVNRQAGDPIDGTVDSLVERQAGGPQPRAPKIL